MMLKHSFMMTLLASCSALRSELGIGRGKLLTVEGLWKPSILLPDRTVRVWLPPGYEDPENRERRYPVLYVNDGQNAMEDSSSWTGYSWRLGAALTRLHDAGKLAGHPPICVLVDNMVGDLGVPLLRRRHLEYGDGWWADAYVSAVCDELKPRVDGRFRTLKGPRHTAQLGTSLGGQVAFLAAWRRPDVFGSAACLSPAFQSALLADVALASRATVHARLGHPHARLYLDNGGDVDGVASVPWFEAQDVVAAGALGLGLDRRRPAAAAAAAAVPEREDETAASRYARLNPGYFWLDTWLQPGVDAMRAALAVHGIATPTLAYHKEPGARHNERAWGQRMERPLLHLYGHGGCSGSGGTGADEPAATRSPRYIKGL